MNPVIFRIVVNIVVIAVIISVPESPVVTVIV
jgi:hypothetical protein